MCSKEDGTHCWNGISIDSKIARCLAKEKENVSRDTLRASLEACST